MLVQCFTSQPSTLSLIGTPETQRSEETRSFVHLNRHLGGGWSSAVYASRSSRIIVKPVAVPKKAKVTLERHFVNEKAVYDKFYDLTGRVIPFRYGGYEGRDSGRRAPVLSDEGTSLSELGTGEMERFSTLGLTERCDPPSQIFC